MACGGVDGSITPTEQDPIYSTEGGSEVESRDTTQIDELAQTSGFDYSTEGGGDLESRGLEAREKPNVVDAIASVVTLILAHVEADNYGRGEFTRLTVREGRARWPQYNWVICHTDHRTYFDGKKNVNWGHYHREYDIRIGGTIGYEIYWFESGRFERRGDGGWTNWAWKGDLVREENGGKTVIFR